MLTAVVETQEACSAAQQGAVTGPSIDLGVCIIKNVSQCLAAHTPWITCTEQTAVTCGTDAASVVSIYAEHRAAEVREGYIVPVDAGAPEASAPHAELAPLSPACADLRMHHCNGWAAPDCDARIEEYQYQCRHPGNPAAFLMTTDHAQ
jgi:hypothetical protein